MIYRFALFTAMASFLLIIAGGLVTSTDSGLSVPDWPLAYGRLFPPMVGGIRFEHTHRMIAAFVGLLTLILTLWILWKEPRRSVRWFGILAFGLVVFQAILGGITVLWQLPLPISLAHACLGPVFFSSLLVLATLLSPHGRNAVSPPIYRPSLVFFAFLALFGQLLSGAILRHTGIGLTYHLSLALVATALVLLLRNSLLTGLLFLQLLLGGLTLLTGNSVLFATAHVAVGALILGSISPLCLQSSQRFSVYLRLTKPRLTGLAVLTSLIGFLLGSQETLNLAKLLACLLGTALVGAGAGALNQLLEIQSDSKMQRTKNRPLPKGEISPESALSFGVIASVGGLILLTFGASLLAGTLACLTLSVYLFLYTPLKSLTPFCTLIGAIPGAIPPLIGWAAARGSLGTEAWLLFAILFLWQLPHFLAIAWIFREDYRKAGFKMLPVIDPKGGLTFRQITLYSLALIPVSLLPAAFGLAGWIYFLTALIGSGAFFALGLFTALGSHSGEATHRLFLASLLYLPSILITLTLDRVLT